jgi:hypothetical protein
MLVVPGVGIVMSGCPGVGGVLAVCLTAAPMMAVVMHGDTSQALGAGISMTPASPIRVMR